ncbi:MAG: RNA-binding domain-containing protein [bacterium]
MNLSVLERMARNGDMSVDGLRYLLSCKGECEWLDFKEDIHIDHEMELCNFARDVLGIKNVGGGFIVVGVQDKSWKPVGLKDPLPFDSKMLRDKIRKATGLDLDVDIVHHKIHVPDSTGLFAIIFVRSSRKRQKRRIPTLATIDYCATASFGLRRGDIYIRKGDSTIRVSTHEELEDLLDQLEDQADNDSLTQVGRGSPFAIHQGTYLLLEKGFEQFIGRKTLRSSLLEAITKDPRIWIINVHGPGGSGKTAIVNWAVYEFFHKRDFEAIIQLTAKDSVLTTQGIEKYGRTLYSLDNMLDHVLKAFDEPPPPELEDKKRIVVEYLSVWPTLLVLDNMETVQDGRILSFVQSLPPDTKAKILMTSRQKTGGWELPFPINELQIDEVQEFIRIRSDEMGISFPTDRATVEKVWAATGGLPLAIQWVLGRYRIKPNIAAIAAVVAAKDSPVLEFSFRNIWQILSPDAKTILAIITVFDDPPTVQSICIATQFAPEKVEKALSELDEVTLVNRVTSTVDGRVTYVALPITLAFARNQLAEMGDFEIQCRQRFQKFSEQIELQESEMFRFRSRFQQYGIETDNEKRAAILCQRGESDIFLGNVSNADILFKQARDTAPQSSYVYAMSASYELARNRIGDALSFIEIACSRAVKKTGALCYTIKAQIMDAQRHKNERVSALAKALEYAPEDQVIRHQYGVALSRAGNTETAISEFTAIIDAEKMKPTPTVQMLIALKTRMINLRRLDRDDELQRDRVTVMEIFKKYPHLAGEAYQFDEFLN